jgi:hypothetical protein
MVAVATVLGVSAPALAATVRLEVRTVGDHQVAQLVFRAAPSERNRIGISDREPGTRRSDPVRDYWVRDYGYGHFSAVAGAGCVGPEDPLFPAIRCPIPAGVRPGGPIVFLGDGNDGAEVDGRGVPARVLGGNGSDGLTADGFVDGGPGNDSVSGSGRLIGGPGNDWLEGSGRLAGGRGRDHLEGSGRLTGGPGVDYLIGARERDVIVARDGSSDQVDCGAGRDTAILDGRDMPLRCERLRRRGAARAVPLDVWGEAPGDVSPEWGVNVGCPPDGPAVCVGDVTLSGNGQVIRQYAFRAMRGHVQRQVLGEGSRLANFLRRLDGERVWVRVRSYDRRGRLQAASAPFHVSVSWPDHDSP